LRAFARAGKPTAALVVAVVELTAFGQEMARTSPPDPPKSARWWRAIPISD